MMTRWLVFAWVLLSGLGPGLASASDFMDVRLTWTLSDDNLLVGPGKTLVNSPGLGIGGDRSNTVFFDNYDTRYTGFENMGHLVLHKAMPAFFDDFGAEAALFMSLQATSGHAGFADEGSYIRMYYDLSGGLSDDANVEFVLFPLCADRFRMGYSYNLSWGGDAVFPLNDGLVPGARLQLNLPYMYAFFGFKTTRIRENIDDTEQVEQVTNHGLLAGLGMDVDGFVLEAKAAYFTVGTFQEEGLRGQKRYLSGASYQVGYHLGRPIGSSIDFELYRNDPTREMHFFLPEEYDGGFSMLIKHEGSVLTQTLADPDQHGRKRDQLAWAFDLNGAIKIGYWRMHLDAVAQSLAFLLHEMPSFTPFVNFPDEARVRPQLWAALGVDYHFPGPRLTPGLKAGIMRPATYTIDSPDLGGAVFSGRRTVVVRSPASRDILPEGDAARSIYSIKASLKWDYAEMLAVVAELFYSYDDNQVRYVSDFVGLNVYSKYAKPHVLGLNLMVQARF